MRIHRGGSSAARTMGWTSLSPAGGAALGYGNSMPRRLGSQTHPRLMRAGSLAELPCRYAHPSRASEPAARECLDPPARPGHAGSSRPAARDDVVHRRAASAPRSVALARGAQELSVTAGREPVQDLRRGSVVPRTWDSGADRGHSGTGRGMPRTIPPPRARPLRRPRTRLRAACGPRSSPSNSPSGC